MQIFEEVRFPTEIAYGAIGGPEYATSVTESANGYEMRNIGWSQPRHRYQVSHGVKTQEQLEILLAFFHSCKGRAIGFRMKDWADYQAQSQQIGIGDGTTREFQLIKTYVISSDGTHFGNNATNRNINKPVPGTVRIYLDSVEQQSGWNIDHSTGIVIFNIAPDAGVQIEADFEFDVPVRFDTDQIATTLDAYQVQSMPDIPLIELRI